DVGALILHDTVIAGLQGPFLYGWNDRVGVGSWSNRGGPHGPKHWVAGCHAGDAGELPSVFAYLQRVGSVGQKVGRGTGYPQRQRYQLLEQTHNGQRGMVA